LQGKRVNFAGRSVISPDPNIATNQVGVPTAIAKKLIKPEYVSKLNVERIKRFIVNGSDKWPGCAIVQYRSGKKKSLVGIIHHLFTSQVV